jgi:O-antigen/teichoic acid export membrane protein
MAPRLSERARGLGGKAFWNLVDQAVSSLGSAVGSFLIARAVGAADFGVFGVCFTIYTVMIGITRGLGGQPYAIRYPLDKGLAQPRLAGVCFGVTLTTGALLAPVLVGLSFFFRGDGHQLAILVFALLLPALLMQDTVRTVLLAQGRAKVAAANDAATTLFQTVSVIGGTLAGFGVEGLITCWALGGVVGSVLGCVQLRSRPLFAPIRSWLAEVGPVGWPLVGEWTALVGFSQVSYFGIGAVAGVASLGSLRAAQTLIGPLGTFGLAVTAFAIPQLAARRLTGSAAKKFTLAVAAVLLVGNLTWGAILFSLPTSVGQGLLGDSWAGARGVLLALFAQQVAMALVTGPNTVLAAMSMTGRTFKVGLVHGVLLAVLGLGGVLTLGFHAATWGLALATTLCVPYAWWQLDRGTKERDQSELAPSATTSPSVGNA